MPVVGKLYRASEMLCALEVPEYGSLYEEQDAGRLLIPGVDPYRFFRPGTIVLYLGNRHRKHWLLHNEKIYMYSGIGRLGYPDDFEHLWEIINE